MARFGFDVDPTFEDLPMAPSERHPLGICKRGSVMHVGVTGLPIAAEGEIPSVRLHILRTDLPLGHGDLQYESQHPYARDETPVTTLMWGHRPVRVAARYTLWPANRGGGLELGVMLGAGAGRVESNRQYGGLRRAIAVSVAQAVLEAEGVDPSISLIVRNNFEDYPIHYQDYVGAAGLEDLAQVLDTNRAFPTIPPRTS